MRRLPTRQRCRWLALAAMVVGVLMAASASGAVLDLGATDASVDLARHVSVFEDCSGRSDADGALALAAAGRFVEASARSLSFGYSGCSYWMRLEVRDTTPHPREWMVVLGNPRVDVFELHEPGRVLRSGNLIALPDRPVRSRYPAFVLGPIGGEVRTAYLRARTSDVATFPLRLIERQAFVAEDHHEQMALGIYYGIILFAALFNAFVFAYLRDFAYLHYVSLIVTYGLFQAAVNGLDIEYFWPTRPSLNMTAIPVLCGLTIMSAATFSWRFLNLSERSPKLWYVEWLAIAAGALLVGTCLAGFITLAGILGSILAPIAVTGMGVMGVVVHVKGCQHARYFLLAGSLQFSGVILNALRNLALIPATFLTTYGNQVGSALFVLCLSLALMARFNLLRREKAIAELKTTEAKLQALQAKINPHFLFNTLNTIAGLISEAPERAEGVVLKLSKLFRYTLTATEKQQVALTDELAIVRSYLEIEQARFGERLKFEIRTEGNLDGMSLPGLTVQPLVENSVKHGLRSKVDGGTVTVTARVDADACRLTVEDDGAGMDVHAAQTGHGLSSVRERLRLAYGEEFEMALSSRAGVRIDIRLPVRREA